MQGRQTSVEPGVTHQGRKAIHALQQPLMARNSGGVFRLSPQPHPLQCCAQGLSRQLGSASPAGHWSRIGHRRRLLKAGHEGVIDALLEAPNQRGRSQSPAPPLSPCHVLVGSDQLQCPPLRSPGD